MLRVLTNRTSVTEGRAPYSEPRSLRSATATLNSAIHVDLSEIEGLQLAQQLGEVAIYRVLPRL